MSTIRTVEHAQKSLSKILDIIVHDELIGETAEKLNVPSADESSLPPLIEMSPASSVSSTPRKRSKLPILQRLTVLLEGLLDFKYKACWMFVFLLCRHLFRLLAEKGFFLLANILTELAELRCMDEPPYKAHLEEAIAAAIRYCGPQNVLSVISLNMPTADVLQLVSMDKAILKLSAMVDE